MHRATPSLFIVAVILAGCLGASPSDTPLDPSLSIGTGEGGIRGLVLSDELFPVAGAAIAVGTTQLAVSDEAGSFEVGGLPAGTLTLNVTAEGYEPTEHVVEVPLEGFVDVQVPMRGIPGRSPYKVTYIYEGFMICTYAWPYGSGPFPSPCPLGERRSGTRYTVGPDWRGGVHEMVWKTSEEMVFSSSLVPNCLARAPPQQSDPCPALIWGHSPLRVIARPNDPVYAKKYAIDGKAMWPEANHTSHIFGGYSGYLCSEFNQTFYPACVQVNRQFNVPEHWGCPFGFGYSTGIRFQFYHTTFYLEAPAALESFSALPDQ